MEEGNIKVVCRFRPLNESEKKRGSNLCVNFLSNQTVAIQGESAENLKFNFDRIFTPDSHQAEVYKTSAQPIVEAVMQGFNGTVFAYGQTSSGKTFTMTGDPDDPDLMGIIPRMVNTVFDMISSSDDCIEYSVKISYCEIYLEKIKDLLDTAKINLKIHEDKARGVFIDGLSEHYVSADNEVYELMSVGSNNREVAYTNMNSGSSRSHSLFVITVSQTNSRDYSGKVGKLFLVDLAGSEKVGKTGAAGMRLEEAKNINKSLTVLGQVINALTDGKSTHIPYRDSKLTRVLQDSLGGNSKTSLIVTCSPSPYNEMETISSLRFGIRAKAIKNKPKVNREYTIAELKILLSKSQEELEKRANYILKLEEKLKSAGQTLPDQTILEKNEKIDLDEVMAEIEDNKTRIGELVEVNKKLSDLNEVMEKDLFQAKAEKLAAVNSANISKEKLKTVEDTFKDHENIIEKLVLTKEKLETSLEELNKTKLLLEQELSKKNTEVNQLKQEMILSPENQIRQRSMTATSLSNLLVSEREEVQLLRQRNQELESTINDFLTGSFPEIKKKNDEYLQSKLNNEKTRWSKERSEIMRDLENRIQKVVDLEIQIDQAKDAYRYLEKNMGKNEKILVKKNEGLEKYIGEISTDYQRELKMKEKLRIDFEYSQKKLEEEQLKNSFLSNKVEELTVLLDDMRNRVSNLEDELSMSSARGRPSCIPGNIKRPIKGGGRQSVLLSRIPGIAGN
jgi:kinesin family protein 5